MIDDRLCIASFGFFNSSASLNQLIFSVLTRDASKRLLAIDLKCDWPQTGLIRPESVRVGEHSEKL